VVLVIFIQSCANPVTPSGGPKDMDPPVMLDADPPLYTKNFSSQRIRIYFDEFIVLKDLLNQLIISPPLNEIPDIKVKGKSLIINLEEELKENTTYNFYFGEAIVDLTEGNPFSNFQYIFSTGDILDSLSIQGNIYNAMDLLPASGINIMLYPDHNDTLPFDSLPYYVKPYYISKSGENGDFKLTNLKDDNYLLFALLDMNTNLIYDQPTEQIAFTDSLITPWYIKPFIPDTLHADTLDQIDTTNIQKQLTGIIHDPPSDINIDLALFKEFDSTQKLLKGSLLKESLISLVFNKGTRNLSIRSLNHDSDDWYIPEYNSKKDTIFYWLRNIESDSLKLEITENDEIFDTIDIRIRKAEKKGLLKGKAKADRKLDIAFSPGVTLLLNKPLHLTFAYPIEQFVNDSLVLVEGEDTLQTALSFTDEISRKAIINHAWKESTKYQLIIPKGSIYDIHGVTQDSIVKTFNTKNILDYGNLFLNLKLENEGQYIIQLINKDKVIIEHIITQDELLTYSLLDPDDYSIKAIYDANRNGEWDTGNYGLKIQPEKVVYFPIDITIRASWDNEEEWILD
jgi:hypothetical protein